MRFVILYSSQVHYVSLIFFFFSPIKFCQLCSWLSGMVPNYQVNEDLILKLAIFALLLTAVVAVLVDDYIISLFCNEGTSVSILSIDLK